MHYIQVFENFVNETINDLKFQSLSFIESTSNPIELKTIESRRLKTTRLKA